MKKILPLFLLIFISGCATIGPASDPYVGTWNYEIYFPQGTPTGTMTITRSGGDYVIQSESNRGVADWNDVAIEDGELVGNYDDQRTRVEVTGNFEGDSFNGNMSVRSVGTFRMEALKQGSEGIDRD